MNSAPPPPPPLPIAGQTPPRFVPVAATALPPPPPPAAIVQAPFIPLPTGIGLELPKRVFWKVIPGPKIDETHWRSPPPGREIQLGENDLREIVLRFRQSNVRMGTRLGRPASDIVNIMDMRRQTNILIMLGTFPKESPESVAEKFGNLIRFISTLAPSELKRKMTCLDKITMHPAKLMDQCKSLGQPPKSANPDLCSLSDSLLATIMCKIQSPAALFKLSQCSRRMYRLVNDESFAPWIAPLEELLQTWRLGPLSLRNGLELLLDHNDLFVCPEEYSHEISSYVGEPAKLAKPERFLKAMMNHEWSGPYIRQILQIYKTLMDGIKCGDDRSLNARAAAREIEDAAEIACGPQVAALIQTVLIHGNTFNKTSRRAFSTSSLCRIGAVSSSTHRRVNFCHYLAGLLESRCPGLLAELTENVAKLSLASRILAQLAVDRDRFSRSAHRASTSFDSELKEFKECFASASCVTMKIENHFAAAGSIQPRAAEILENLSNFLIDLSTASSSLPKQISEILTTAPLDPAPTNPSDTHTLTESLPTGPPAPPPKPTGTKFGSRVAAVSAHLKSVVWSSAASAGGSLWNCHTPEVTHIVKKLSPDLPALEILFARKQGDGGDGGETHLTLGVEQREKLRLDFSLIALQRALSPCGTSGDRGFVRMSCEDLCCLVSALARRRCESLGVATTDSEGGLYVVDPSRVDVLEALIFQLLGDQATLDSFASLLSASAHSDEGSGLVSWVVQCVGRERALRLFAEFGLLKLCAGVSESAENAECIQQIIAEINLTENMDFIRRFLWSVLRLGHFMNRDGTVRGFYLDSVPRLRDVKGTDTHSSLLHCIVCLMKREIPNFSADLRRLFAVCERAVKCPAFFGIRNTPHLADAMQVESIKSVCGVAFVGVQEMARGCAARGVKISEDLNALGVYLGVGANTPIQKGEGANDVFPNLLRVFSACIQADVELRFGLLTEEARRVHAKDSSMEPPRETRIQNLPQNVELGFNNRLWSRLSQSDSLSTFLGDSSFCRIVAALHERLSDPHAEVGDGASSELLALVLSLDGPEGGGSGGDILYNEFGAIAKIGEHYYITRDTHDGAVADVDTGGRKLWSAIRVLQNRRR